MKSLASISNVKSLAFRTALASCLLLLVLGSDAFAYGKKRAPVSAPVSPPVLVPTSVAPAATPLPAFTGQIGVHYQPPMIPKKISDVAVVKLDGSKVYSNSYNQDDGWSSSEYYSYINQNNTNYFWATGNSSFGYMDWLYTYTNNLYGYGGTCLDDNCYTEQTDQGGIRVNRIYSERQPLLDGPGLPGKWFEYFNPVDEKKQVDVMKNSGVDFVAFLAGWNATSLGNCPPSTNRLQNDRSLANVSVNLTYGCTAQTQAMDYFFVENYNRSQNQRVLGAVEMEDIFEIQNPNWLATHTGSDYEAIFLARIQYYIDNYFKYGSGLYLYHNGMPVIFTFDTGSTMMNIAALNQPISMQQILTDANALARKNGYPQGIYFVDSESTIVKTCTNDGNVLCKTGKNSYGYANSQYTLNDYSNYQNLIAQTGFNAQTGWIYHGISVNSQSYSEMTKNYSNIWNSLVSNVEQNIEQKYPNFKYFLPVTPGWDSRAVGEVKTLPDTYDLNRSCDGAFDSGHNYDPAPYGCSPDNALFATMLSNARTVIANHPATTDQILMVGTWNDVGEGTYLEPTVGDQGAHAQALIDTFRPGLSISSSALADAFSQVLAMANRSMASVAPTTTTKNDPATVAAIAVSIILEQ